MTFPRTVIPPSETSPWILVFVPLYGLIIRPTLFHCWPGLRPWNDWALLAITVTFLVGYYFSKKKLSPGNALNLSHTGPHLFLGLGAGALIVLLPILLDQLIDATPLSQEPLFVGAETRTLEQPPLSFLTIFEIVILRPLLGQFILILYFLQPMTGRVRQISFILLAALLFPVLFWKFSLGVALLGAVSAWMFWFTGTIYAGISFQALCGLAGILVIYVVPRTLTLFGVLL